jgi:RNA polymerase primary sigma factor
MTRPTNATLTAAIIAARAHHAERPTRQRRQALERAVNACLEANMGLVAVIAARFLGKARTLTLADLCQEGALGLHRALQTFDPSRGWALSTYASFWIRQTIRRAIDSTDLTIRVPVGLLETKRMQVGISNRIRSAYGREPTVEEVLDSARTSHHSARTAFELDTSPPASLDRTTYDDGPAWVEMFASDDETPEATALRVSRERLARELLATLSPRERGILEARMGERTLDSIGAQHGVTRERIRQIEAGAMVKLRRTAKLRGLRGAVAAG